QAPRAGEFVLTEKGIEGSLVYALSAPIRQLIHSKGEATVYLDLLPQRSLEVVKKALLKPRGSNSMAKHLHRTLGLDGVKAALMRELLAPEQFDDHTRLARSIKALPITLVGIRPLDEAISSAGGVPFEQLDANLMLNALPGVFCAGEMLDWEAPTGGYLLTGCFASGRRAGQGIINWLNKAKA
ncbi:MAG: NAD(P)/FAD-dependent oxidoreductase, partial [Pseudomonas marincola]|uniref:NAD(P)/FAD-dependent oxidoreductase n=2 Tax=Pseudomonas TaxID=286 RepID=UPI0030026D1F